MYDHAIRDNIEKLFHKLHKKNRLLLIIIDKKLTEIRLNPYHYKPLRKPMQHLRRVHIGKSFVLVYSINEKTKTIIIEDFAHHDEAY